MVLTVSFVLSPVIGLFVTVIGVMRAPRRLGTSVEMPEPHDFAVRAQHRSAFDAAASIASRTQRS
jgi:hypothetical protein